LEKTYTLLLINFIKKYIKKSTFLQKKYTLLTKLKINNIRLNNNFMLFLFLQQFIGTNVYIRESH